MSIAISDLIASAETIRTNNLPDSNTPELVGSTMKNALLLLQDLQSAKDGPYYIDVSISDAQNLPSSPTDQQKLTAYLIGSYVYVWNGTAWTPKQFAGPVGEKGDKGDSGVTDAASVVAISDYTAGGGSDATKVYVGTANALKNLYLYACKLSSTLNIDQLYPLANGYYTLATAIAAVETNLRAANKKIMFTSASGVQETYQYTNIDVANWLTVANWEVISITGKYGNLGVISNLNTIARTGNYTAYGTATGAPSTAYSWFIEHINSSAGTVTAYQRAIAYSTDSVIYERTKIGSVWGDWINKSMKAETYTNGDGLIFNGENGRFEGIDLTIPTAYLSNFKRIPSNMVINTVLIENIKGYYTSNGVDIIENRNCSITDFVPVENEKQYFIIYPPKFSVTPLFGYDTEGNLVNNGVSMYTVDNILYKVIFHNPVVKAKFNVLKNNNNFLFEGFFSTKVTNKSNEKSLIQSYIPLEKSMTFGSDYQDKCYINDNILFPEVNCRVTDFIKIKPNSIIAFNINSNNLTYIGCIYDSNKEFIKTIKTDGNIFYRNSEIKFLMPDNAEYIRINISKNYGSFAHYDSIFLNKQAICIDAIEGINVNKSDNLAENLTYKRDYYLDNNNQEQPFLTQKYGIEYIPILPNTIYTKYPNAEFSGVWYDSNKNPIGILSSTNYLNKVQYTSPSNAAFVRLNCQSEYEPIFAKGNYKNQITIPNFIPMTNWYNKKIAWYGTSIPAGYPHQDNQDLYAYPNRVASLLGAYIQNYCVPNGVIRSSKSDGSSMGGRDTLSFTNLNSQINYKTNMIDLIGTLNEPDLFVFDYSVNDMDADPTDINDVENYDFTSENTHTFLGAYNFVLKQLFTAKKRSRVLMLTHYSDDGISGGTLTGKNVWKKMNDLIIKISDYWKIPVIPVGGIKFQE